VVSWHFEANSPSRLYGVDAIDPDGMILDIGPSSLERIQGAIDDAHTVVWDGPLGAFEMQPFDKGTVALAQYVAKRTHEGKLVSVAGGGDTVSALAHAGVKEKFTYVSTAGGAFLEWMEGKPLPGVEALKKRANGWHSSRPLLLRRLAACHTRSAFRRINAGLIASAMTKV